MWSLLADAHADWNRLGVGSRPVPSPLMGCGAEGRVWVSGGGFVYGGLTQFSLVGLVVGVSLTILQFVLWVGLGLILWSYHVSILSLSFVPSETRARAYFF